MRSVILFISTAKAFLSLLAVAEGDYLYYVQSKLLPHKLSFDHHPTPSTPARGASQPTQCESRPVIVEAQTHTSPFATSTLQLDTSDRNLFAEYTTLEDFHASDDIVGVDTEMSDHRDEGDVEARTHPFVSSSVSPNGLHIAGDSSVALNNIMNDVAETRDEHPSHADSTVDLRSCSTRFTIRSPQSLDGSAATESRAQETSQHSSRELATVEDCSFRRISSSPREDDLNAVSRVTGVPSTTWDNALDVPLADSANRPASTSMRDSSLPFYMCSAASTPSLLSSNPSPVTEHELIWPEGSPQTPYARCVQRLDLLHPDVQKHIPNIIKLGDSFLREDVVTSLKSFCRGWSRTDLCNRPALSNSASSDLRIKSLLRGYYHAEAFKCRSVVDRLKLRFLRILLYHDFEGLRIDIQNKLVKYGLLSDGQDAASLATDEILHEFDRAYREDVDAQSNKQRRTSFQRHKSIGRRWSVLASYLGLGIFLTCSSTLEARLNDRNFAERRISALLTYILNVYPQGSQLSRELDPFVLSIIQGVSPPLWPTAASLSILDSYRQEDERRSMDFRAGWLRTDIHDVFYRII